MEKFGNSLLLRIGMRLSKVNPELAGTTAKAAIDGGIMNEAKDMCRVRHIAGGRDDDKNPVTLRFQKDNYIGQDKVKISRTFMNHLKDTQDPRISVFCSLKDGNSNPELQKGLPNGYDKNTISTCPDYTGKSRNIPISTLKSFYAKTLQLCSSCRVKASCFKQKQLCANGFRVIQTSCIKKLFVFLCRNKRKLME